MLYLPVLLLAVLAVAGAAVGIALAFSGTGGPDRRRSADAGLLRLTAQVHTGWEQTLLGLFRELGLPRRSEGLSYGELYVETQNEQRLLIRSRSEIGRGFIGALELRPARRSTTGTYTILRLPGDEDVRDRVLELELNMIAALRRVDREVEVEFTGGTLREFERRQIEVEAPGDGVVDER